MLALTYDELKALDPCKDSLRRVAKLMGGAKSWNGKKVDAASARAAGATFDDLIWVASAIARTNPDVERRLRLWMADCAARVLYVYEADPNADERPRNAIIAAYRYARGEIDAAAWVAAGDAAWVSAWAAAGDAARAAVRAVARAVAWVSAWAAAGDAARAAVRAAVRAAAGDAAGDAEQAWQFDRLVARLSEREPDDYPLPLISARASKEQAHGSH